MLAQETKLQLVVAGSSNYNSKTAAKQAYLMHLAANMTSESDEAGVSDDSHDYYSHNVYSAPGDSD